MLKVLTGNIFYLSVSTLINKLFYFLVVTLIARYLGVVELGKYSFVFSFVMIFSVFLDMGLFTLAVKDVSREKENASEYLGNIMTLKIFFSFFTFFLILFITYIIRPWFRDDQDIHLIYLFCIFITIDALSLIAKIAFRAYEKVKYEMITEAIGKSLGLLLVITVLLLKLGLTFIILAMVIGNLTVFMIGLAIVKKKFVNFRLRFDIGVWKYLLTASLPLIGAWFFMSAYTNLDKVFLKLFRNNEAVGQYNAAYVLFNAIQLIPFILCSVLLPVMSRWYRENKEDLRELCSISMKYILFVAVLISSILFCFSALVMRLCFKFDSISLMVASSSLQIIIWSGIPVFAYSLTNILFLCADAQHLLFWVNAVGFFMSLFLNLILIYYFGINGACISVLLIHSAIFIASFTLVHRYIFHMGIGQDLLRLFLAIVVFVFIYLNTRFMGMNVSSTFAVLSFVVTLFFSGFFAKEDLLKAKESFKTIMITNA